MCIILAKPAGVDLPSEDILNNCQSSNRDGIGFAFNMTGNSVVISKGFDDVRKLVRMWDVFNVRKEHNLLVHFRTATHGEKDRGNCHPFPLTNDFQNMRELHSVCEVAVTHNGMFGSMKAHKTYSDTMKFVATILASPEIIANLHSKPVVELIRGYCGHSSKLAFLQPSGITTIGEFEKEDGILYSNRQYKCWMNSNWTGHQSSWLTDKKDDLGLPESIGKDLVTITCEYCKTTEGVRYNNEFQANLCETCCVLHIQGYN